MTWRWRVTYGTTRIASGRCASQEDAQEAGRAERARFIADGMDAERLGYYVEPERAREAVS